MCVSVAAHYFPTVDKCNPPRLYLHLSCSGFGDLVFGILRAETVCCSWSGLETQSFDFILFFKKCLVYFNKQRFITVCVHSLDSGSGVVLCCPPVVITPAAAVEE